MTQNLPSGLDIVTRPRQVEASLWRRLRFENQSGCREAIFRNYTPSPRNSAPNFAGGSYRRARRFRAASIRRPSGGDRPLRSLARIDIRRVCQAKNQSHRRWSGPFKRSRRAIQPAAAHQLERLRSVSSGVSPSSGDYIAEVSDLAIALALGLIIEQSPHGDITGEASSINGYHSRDWQELQHSVLREIDRLPDNEKTVLQQHYLHDVSFKLIADMLKVSKGRVSQLHRAALEKIRARMNSMSKLCPKSR